jgi:hypothetical protein
LLTSRHENSCRQCHDSREAVCKGRLFPLYAGQRMNPELICNHLLRWCTLAHGLLFTGKLGGVVTTRRVSRDSLARVTAAPRREAGRLHQVQLSACSWVSWCWVWTDSVASLPGLNEFLCRLKLLCCPCRADVAAAGHDGTSYDSRQDMMRLATATTADGTIHECGSAIDVVKQKQSQRRASWVLEAVRGP